jgi:hypothetical protein
MFMMISPFAESLSAGGWNSSSAADHCESQA